MKAVIMAGGKGTRLRPLTSYLPKPMVPLLGRPCMEYIIDLLKKHGITEIAVTLQYLPESIKNYFGDGSDFGVKIVYFEENAPLGTAGSVKNCEDFLDDRFLVISGDALTDFNLEEAIGFHENNQSLATLILTHAENPLEYGVVMTDDDGHVTRFLEKPTWSEVFSDTVNTGIYILEPEVLHRFEKNREFDFSKDLFPILLNAGDRLMGYIADGYWSDIGNLEVYREAQFHILDGKVQVEIKAEELLPGVFVEEDVRIVDRQSIRGPVFLGRGTFIEKGATVDSYSILGRHNMVKTGALISKSVFWDHNYIGRKAEIQGATICQRSLIHDHCQLAEGVVMGNDCRIGEKSHIKAGVKIWPSKDVESNSTVHSSLIWGVKLSRNLFGSQGIKGIPNVDVTPDFAARLAAAMATIFKPGSTVSLSSCSHSFSQVIKQAMWIGLNAAGIHTVDFGISVCSATRYGIRAYSTDWGIHIGTRQSGDGVITIEVLDKQGIPIDKSIERKIENAYWQEDFVRAATDKIGSHRHLPIVSDDYFAALKREIKVDEVVNSRFKVVLDYDLHSLGGTAVSLLSSMGCQVIQISTRDRTTVRELRDVVQKNKADMGIRIEQDACQFTILTNEGKVVSDDRMIALQLLLHCGSDPSFCLGIPVSAPYEMEMLAQQLGMRVVRTKENSREMMQVVEGIRFQPLFDAFYTMVKLIGYLAEEKQPLSEIMEELPSFHMARQAVFCDWKNKGKVMRMMMEDTKGKEVELLDGIKFYDSDGWVLIMPDLDQPHVRVITQGASMEIASSLAKTYAERIEKYQTT